uniref:DNA-directed RNA polymerase I subunit RPA12 n=1 Tax=Acanthochromis polyacanthus TaxID=80966 RepID=A0A3Q1FPM4_9TELE
MWSMGSERMSERAGVCRVCPNLFLSLIRISPLSTIYFPEFSNQKICSTVVFNPLEQSSVAPEDEEDSELKGPVIDRRCSRCNKEGMIYHTRQMRSADEGQTVFFTCIHCRYQEKEDS